MLVTINQVGAHWCATTSLILSILEYLVYREGGESTDDDCLDRTVVRVRRVPETLVRAHVDHYPGVTVKLIEDGAIPWGTVWRRKLTKRLVEALPEGASIVSLTTMFEEKVGPGKTRKATWDRASMAGAAHHECAIAWNKRQLDYHLECAIGRMPISTSLHLNSKVKVEEPLSFRLTKSLLCRLPEGVYLRSTCSAFQTRIGPPETIESTWQDALAHRANGRLCCVTPQEFAS